MNNNLLKLLAGQALSLLATRILKISFVLYVLDLSHSASILGKILAFSILPMILLSPVSGSLVDRLNRKWIMVCLDAFSLLSVAVFLIILPSFTEKIYIIGALLTVLSLFNTFETPTVQASIPMLVDTTFLPKANAFISQIHSLSNLIGPMFGGFLYGILGLNRTIYIAMFLYCVAVGIEIFIDMPRIKNKIEKKKIVFIVRDDMQASLKFLTEKEPLMLKMFIIIAVYNLFITSMLHIGLPYIVKVVLGISSELYGILETVMAIGAMIGGVVIAFAGNRMEIKKSYICLMVAVMGYISLAVVNTKAIWCSYFLITGGIFVVMIMETIFDIQMMSFIQKSTPGDLMGKVFSVNMLIVLCAQPVGELLYGYLFEQFKANTNIVVMFSVLSGIIIVGILYRITNSYRNPIS